jgi:hypothetical protein
MRVVFWLLVGIGFMYAFYSGAIAAYSYFQVKDAVTETVGERWAVDRYERAGRIKQEILKKASQSGVVLDEREVSVTEDDRMLLVRIRWSYPVFVYKGEPFYSQRFSYEKSFQLPAAR